MSELYEILQKEIAGEIIPSKKAVKICRTAKNYTKKIEISNKYFREKKGKKIDPNAPGGLQ